jgi:hypothetical protein
MISKSLNFIFSVTVRPRDPFLLAMVPDLVDQRLKFGDHRLELGKVAGKSVFCTDRLPNSVRPHLPVIDAPRDPVVVAAGFTEVCLHKLERLVSHVETGMETERVHLGAGRWTDAVEFADR